MSAETELTVEIPLALLSALLDEVWLLRNLAAYEAAVREADLAYKSYPKGRRGAAKRAVDMLRRAARGELGYPLAPSDVLHRVREAAGMPHTLTRHAYGLQKLGRAV